jgi:hypothetical protein
MGRNAVAIADWLGAGVWAKAGTVATVDTAKTAASAQWALFMPPSVGKVLFTTRGAGHLEDFMSGGRQPLDAEIS